ncbi:MAG: hypothetical protein JNM10_10405, partial [Planctomycetia bacterium]|nr:hypothetical protein [Planctomycetia bacterium]
TAGTGPKRLALTFDEDADPAPTVHVPLAPPRPEEAGSGPVGVVVSYIGDGARPRVLELECVLDGRYDATVRLRLDGARPTGRLPRATTYRIDAVLDGWASDQVWRELASSLEDSLVLDLVLPVARVLEVVDAVRGEPVAGAYADEFHWSDNSSDDVPGRPYTHDEHVERRARTAADASGRIALGPSVRATAVWIGAPGHAWTSLWVELVPTPQRVVLPRGGGVRVDVRGAERLRDACVLVRRDDGNEPQDDPASGGFAGVEAYPTDVAGAFVLEGLAPGRWLAAVGPRSARLSQEAPSASSPFEVVAGNTTVVTLTPADVPSEAELSVVFEFRSSQPRAASATWDLSGAGRKTRGLARDLEVPATDATGVARVGVRGLRRGPYQLTDAESGWGCFVKVREADEVVTVVVPPPGRIRVRVLGTGDRRPLPEAGVRLEYGGPSAMGGSAGEAVDGVPPTPSATDEAFAVTSWSGGRTQVPFDRVAKCHAASVPSGRVEVVASMAGFVERRVEATITPGDAAVELEVLLDAAAIVVVRVTQGGKPAPQLVGEISLGRVAPDGAGGSDMSWSSWRSDVSEAVFDGLEPGTYQASWRRDERTEAVTATVTVKAGERVEVPLEAK